MKLMELKRDSSPTNERMIKISNKYNIVERKFPKKKINFNFRNYYINNINYFCFSYNLFLWF